MSALPDPLLAVLLGLVGLVVGSFLNVVVHRVPAGDSVVSPRSACPACRSPIARRDLVPVVSWLLLRGRCRSCRTRIGIRYPLVEAATGAAFAALALWRGPSWALLPLLYLAAVGIALTLIDIDVKRLPHIIVLPSYPVLLLLLVPDALAQGQWWPLVRALAGGLALYLFYELLARLYPGGGGMGGGDVNLSGVLGIVLAWQGWPELVVGGFAGFLLGGLWAIPLLALGKAGRKARIPFGPFMIAGAWVGLVAAGPVTDWYLGAAHLA